MTLDRDRVLANHILDAADAIELFVSERLCCINHSITWVDLVH